MAAQPVSPQLFGRDAELAELERWLEAAGAAQRRVLLLDGEAGVGKSRLIEATLQAPAAGRYMLLRAYCLDGDEAEPYALIRSLAVAAAGRPAALAVVPAPEAERQVRHVQQALSPLLQQGRGDRPLLVVVEDMHWSDTPSLQVLLGLGLQPDPVRFLLSFRPQPVTPGFAAFLGDTSRLRLGSSITLQPLSTAATARMVRAMLNLQEALPLALLDEIMAATEGFPFLVEELVTTLIQRGDLAPDGSSWRFRPGTALAVPASLRHSIEARLLLLSPSVVKVAEQAAILGQELNLEQLTGLSELDEPAIFTAVRALIEAQILVRRPDGTVTFRHALTREALRTRQFPAERRALHRRVAQILEDEGDASEATLAYHWSKAGDKRRAATYALEAACRAAAVHAHREAIAHYEVALSGANVPRAEVLTALGDHHQALGEREQAVARYEEAQALHRTARDVTAVARLDLRLGRAYDAQRSRQHALHHLEAAFTGLPLDHDERWHAGLYLGLQQAASGHYEAAETTFLAAQEATGAEAVARLRIAYELGGLRALRGEWAALEEAGQRVLREAPRASDEGLALRHDAHAALGSVAYYRGALASSLEHFTACLRIAQERGLATQQALARWNLAANALYHLGHWLEAHEQLAELQTLGTSGPVEGAIVFELWLRGKWEQAAESWLRVWPELMASADLEVQMAFGRRIADVLLALGRHHEAVELLDPVLAQLQQLEARSFLLQLLPRQVEALARLGDRQALPIAGEGLGMARALGGRPAEGLLLRGRALARQQAGHWLEAFADYDAAAAILAGLPMPYELARTQREAGLARLARGRRGDRQRAADLLRTARQQFADLGARRDENATGAVLSAAGLAGDRERGPGPLTVREQEVAELVTLGLSNREIAERLFITEKTAAYHVGNILNKLDFSSRAQIAAYITNND